MERNAALAADNLTIELESGAELGPVQLEDAEELHAVVDRNRDRLHRWLVWAGPHYSIDDARRFLGERIAEFADRGSLTMTIRRHGELCGAIGLHRIDRRHKSTSIGYWIDAAHERKGIVTEACGAIVTEGFLTLGLHRIEIRCAAGNHRSSAVPRRLGFAEEGILREAEWLHDRWVDLRVFSMLAQDWNK